MIPDRITQSFLLSMHRARDFSNSTFASGANCQYSHPSTLEEWTMSHHQIFDNPREQKSTTLICPVCKVEHHAKSDSNDMDESKGGKKIGQCQETQSSKKDFGGLLVYVKAFCPICLEEECDPPVIALPCGHVVCQKDYVALGGRIQFKTKNNSHVIANNKNCNEINNDGKDSECKPSVMERDIPTQTNTINTQTGNNKDDKKPSKTRSSLVNTEDTVGTTNNSTIISTNDTTQNTIVSSDQQTSRPPKGRNKFRKKKTSSKSQKNKHRNYIRGKHEIKSEAPKENDIHQKHYVWKKTISCSVTVNKTTSATPNKLHSKQKSKQPNVYEERKSRKDTSQKVQNKNNSTVQNNSKKSFSRYRRVCDLKLERKTPKSDFVKCNLNDYDQLPNINESQISSNRAMLSNLRKNNKNSKVKSSVKKQEKSRRTNEIEHIDITFGNASKNKSNYRRKTIDITKCNKIFEGKETKIVSTSSQIKENAHSLKKGSKVSIEKEPKSTPKKLGIDYYWKDSEQGNHQAAKIQNVKSNHPQLKKHDCKYHTKTDEFARNGNGCKQSEKTLVQRISELNVDKKVNPKKKKVDEKVDSKLMKTQRSA